MNGAYRRNTNWYVSASKIFFHISARCSPVVDFQMLLQVRSANKNYQFTAKKRESFKCAIFVARLYSCLRSFSKSIMSSRLMAKAKSCLTIMERHLSGNITHVQQKKKFPELVETQSFRSTRSSSAALPEASDLEAPAKRKRGRPPTNKRVVVSTVNAVVPSAIQGAQKKCKIEHVESVAEGSIPFPPRRRNSEITTVSSTPTIRHIISRFEKQYEEMGQIYNEMGTTLAQMKGAANGSERTEEQIRADLLEEVQRSIMNSLPKK